jgi:hypothetical protein
MPGSFSSGLRTSKWLIVVALIGEALFLAFGIYSIYAASVPCQNADTQFSPTISVIFSLDASWVSSNTFCTTPYNGVDVYHANFCEATGTMTLPNSTAGGGTQTNFQYLQSCVPDFNSSYGLFFVLNAPVLGETLNKNQIFYRRSNMTVRTWL